MKHTQHDEHDVWKQDVEDKMIEASKQRDQKQQLSIVNEQEVKFKVGVGQGKEN